MPNHYIFIHPAGVGSNYTHGLVAEDCLWWHDTIYFLHIRHANTRCLARGVSVIHSKTKLSTFKRRRVTCKADRNQVVRIQERHHSCEVLWRKHWTLRRMLGSLMVINTDEVFERLSLAYSSRVSHIQSFIIFVICICIHAARVSAASERTKQQNGDKIEHGECRCGQGVEQTRPVAA